MEKASPRSLHHSISLAEPVELLFFCRILSWLIITLLKFSLRSFSFLHSFTELFAFSSAVDEDHLMKNTPSQPRGNIHLSREDLEMVMGRMGLCCSQEDDQLGCMGSDEISGVFNEKEPSLEEVKEAFCVFDENGDGFIDAVELQRILSMLGFGEGEGSDFDSCKRMIAAYDENRDGRIDFNEFVKFMEISFC